MRLLQLRHITILDILCFTGSRIVGLRPNEWLMDAATGKEQLRRSRSNSSYRFMQSPTAGEVPHLTPSAAPPAGQRTETSTSFPSHASAPSL